MKICSTLSSFLIAGLVGLLAVNPALAFSPLPSSFHGKVTVNGQNVADGTVIQAIIAGKQYAEARTHTDQGSSVYSLDIPGDDPSTAAIEGGKEGEAIEFVIGAISPAQTGTWHSGANTQLDLSINITQPAGTTPPAFTPTVTYTPTNPTGGTEPAALTTETGGPAGTQASASTPSPAPTGAITRTPAAKITSLPATAVNSASTQSEGSSPQPANWMLALAFLLIIGGGYWAWSVQQQKE